MKAKLASLTCGCNSLKVPALKIMAALVSILSINSFIRTLTLAGFLSCHGSAFAERIMERPAISGTRSSHQTQIHLYLISSFQPDPGQPDRLRWRHIPNGLRYGGRSFFQGLAHMGECPKPRVWPGWSSPRHPTVHKFLVRFGKRAKPDVDFAVRSI